MFVDASALTAMLVDEDDATVLLTRLRTSSVRWTSALSVWEASVAIGRSLNISIDAALESLDLFTTTLRIEIVPVSAEIGRLAVSAYDRYGKGRHKAALNFGDCFSYACARHHDVPLLYKGNDFSQTDIRSA